MTGRAASPIRPRLRSWSYWRAVIHEDALRAAFGAERVGITSSRPDVPVAVDGELRPDLTAPFEFASRHGGLRLVVPSDPAPRTVEIQLSS